jgi:ABC-type Fe3+/spermidine/putrescine transport system ATPase subunit
LTLVKLDGCGERRIQQLSGGQQQRVALARAMVIRPRCLLLDEPLSNLDAILRLEMRQEIRGICKQFGITAVYVTHDQDEALSMADRIAVMDRGRLQQDAVPLEIYRRPANRMVAEFIGETNFLSGTIANVGMRTDDGQARPSMSPYVEVETHLGIMVATMNAPDWEPLKGQMVTLSIRPEAFLTATKKDPTSSHWNCFRGQVTAATYLGATAQYHIRVGDAASLKISQSNPIRLLSPSSDFIEFFVQPVDVVVLPA